MSELKWVKETLGCYYAINERFAERWSISKVCGNTWLLQRDCGYTDIGHFKGMRTAKEVADIIVSKEAI